MLLHSSGDSQGVCKKELDYNGSFSLCVGAANLTYEESGVTSYHLKEHCSSDSHPMQLNLKGRVEGEVSMIITAAPFGSVTAVVHIHVQSDGLLLRDCGSWRTDEGRVGGAEKRRQEAKEAKKKGRWRHDGQADGGVRAEVESVD